MFTNSQIVPVLWVQQISHVLTVDLHVAHLVTHTHTLSLLSFAGSQGGKEYLVGLLSFVDKYLECKGERDTLQ